MSVSLSAIRMTAMNILAAREHSRKELFNKLQKKYHLNAEADDVDNLIFSVLEQLIADNLLNEERFTESYIRSKKFKGIGPVRIRHELSQKGIANDMINDQLYCIDNEQWLDDIKTQREKKYGKMLPTDIKERNKQSRFLYQRGYPVELINLVLNFRT